MFNSPHFWTPERLDKEEMAKVCQWLSRWQAACVSANSLMEKDVSSELDPAIRKGMENTQALIRHIHALDLIIQERIDFLQKYINQGNNSVILHNEIMFLKGLLHDTPY